MKKMKLASPLFILRHRCETDLFGALSDIKRIGYDGVEFLGFFGKPAADIKKHLDDIGLIPLGNHVPYYEFVGETQKVIEQHKYIGCKYITLGTLPDEVFPGEAGYSRAKEEIARLGEEMHAAGLTLLYHNHAKEHRVVLPDGRQALECIMDDQEEHALMLEPDLGWTAIAGADPVYFLEKYQQRVGVLHWKDYYATAANTAIEVSGLGDLPGDAAHLGFQFAPTGYGIMNYPLLMKPSLACPTEWIVVDHDLAYKRDIIDDLKISLNYVQTLLALYV